MILSKIIFGSFAVINLLAATSEPANVINWLGTIIGGVAIALLTVMTKHVVDTDRHFPKGKSIDNFVTNEQCSERIKNLERISKMMYRLLKIQIERSGGVVPEIDEDES